MDEHEAEYNIQQVESSHKDNLQLALKSLANDEKDLSIVTEDGEGIETWRSLLCLYSSSLVTYLTRAPCCTSSSISLPVSSIALKNLLKILVNGVVKIYALDELDAVAEAAKVFGIDLENIGVDLETDLNELETDLDDAYNIKIESENIDFESGNIESDFGHSKNININTDSENENSNKSYNINFKTEPEILIEATKEENIDIDQETLLQENNEVIVGGEVEDVISQLGNNVSQEVVKNISKMKKTSIDFKVYKKKPTCNQCGKVFIDNYKLNCHMATHSGDKQFACDKCTESFGRKDKLRVHQIKEHKSGSQFKCNLCPARYPDSSFLDEHLKAHKQAEELMQGLM